MNHRSMNVIGNWSTTADRGQWSNKWAQKKWEQTNWKSSQWPLFSSNREELCVLSTYTSGLYIECWFPYPSSEIFIWASLSCEATTFPRQTIIPPSWLFLIRLYNPHSRIFVPAVSIIVFKNFPYSTHLAPCDFFLFPKVKKVPTGITT